MSETMSTKRCSGAPDLPDLASHVVGTKMQGGGVRAPNRPQQRRVIVGSISRGFPTFLILLSLSNSPPFARPPRLTANHDARAQATSLPPPPDPVVAQEALLCPPHHRRPTHQNTRPPFSLKTTAQVLSPPPAQCHSAASAAEAVSPPSPTAGPPAARAGPPQRC
jgi:hypothetical protein